MDETGPGSFLEETVDKWLAQWSGLRLYIRQRRAGAPADAVMDTLLTEVLRLRLGREADPGMLVEHLIRPCPTHPLPGNGTVMDRPTGYTCADEVQNPTRHAFPAELHSPLV